MGYQWTLQLCRLDSDSDGQSNGHELGDPGCALAVDGDGSGREYLTEVALSHPGDPNSTTVRKMPEALKDTVILASLGSTLGHKGLMRAGTTCCLGGRRYRLDAHSAPFSQSAGTVSVQRQGAPACRARDRKTRASRRPHCQCISACHSECRCAHGASTC